MSDPLAAALLDALDDDALEHLADRLAPLLERRVGHQRAEHDGYLAPQAAADYLGVTRKRVYDLTSARALIPDGRDGRTPLYRRETLDHYVRDSA
jgi:hypothetical protein